MDFLVLSDGYVAKYDEEFKGYLVEVDYKGSKIKMTLVPYKENSDSLEALKYSFNELVRDLQAYDNDAMNSICGKLGPYIEQAIPEEPDMTPEELLFNFVLKKVAIMDTIRFGMSEAAGLHIVFSYGKAGSDDPNMELMATGYMDSGFDNFFINGQQLATMPLTMSYDLSCGATANYNYNTEIYEAKVNIFGRDVNCFFETDENELGAKTSTGIFEKLYENIEEYDTKARKLLSEKLDQKIDEVRDELDIPDLTVETIMEGIFLDAIVCCTYEEVELTYCFKGEETEMRAAVTGMLAGFGAVIFDYGEADEFDD